MVSDDNARAEEEITAWQKMGRDERTAHLIPLVGKLVRYTLVDETQTGRAAFGPDFPLIWHEAVLDPLSSPNGSPFLSFDRPPYTRGQPASWNMFRDIQF